MWRTGDGHPGLAAAAGGASLRYIIGSAEASGLSGLSQNGYGCVVVCMCGCAYACMHVCVVVCMLYVWMYGVSMCGVWHVSMDVCVSISTHEVHMPSG